MMIRQHLVSPLGVPMRKGWTALALLAVLLAAAPTLPASADHGGYITKAGFGIARGPYANGCGYRRVTPYERGLRAGRRAGWQRGYDDGLYGRRFFAKAKIGRRGHASRYRRGYLEGFKHAYHDGYHQGRRDRHRPPCR